MQQYVSVPQSAASPAAHRAWYVELVSAWSFITTFAFPGCTAVGMKIFTVCAWRPDHVAPSGDVGASTYGVVAGIGWGERGEERASDKRQIFSGAYQYWRRKP